MLQMLLGLKETRLRNKLQFLLCCRAGSSFSGIPTLNHLPASLKTIWPFSSHCLGALFKNSLALSFTITIFNFPHCKYIEETQPSAGQWPELHFSISCWPRRVCLCSLISSFRTQGNRIKAPGLKSTKLLQEIRGISPMADWKCLRWKIVGAALKWLLVTQRLPVIVYHIMA